MTDRWTAQLQHLLTHGLRARVRVELMPPWEGQRLLALVLTDVDEAMLPRSHAERGFQLHVSLCFEEEVQDWAEVARLAERWRDQEHHFWFWRMGRGGGSELAYADAFVADPIAANLHSRGTYSDRPFHLSL